MTKKKTPTPNDSKPITPPLTHDERTAKFAELAQNAADLLTCGSAFQKVGRHERAFAMIEEARKCITALAVEYPSDSADIFTGPPKAPTARSHKRKADVGTPAID